MPIIQHLVLLYKLWREIVPNLSKTARFTIGEKIDYLFVEIIELIYTAIYLNSQQKAPLIQKAITKTNLLYFFLQIAWETKIIDDKTYIRIAERVVQLGKMLNGWNRQLLTKQNPPA